MKDAARRRREWQMFSRARLIQGLAAGLGGVAAVTILLTRIVPANASTAGFFYLVVVLGVATGSGFSAAAAVAVAATLCYNYYFFPPVGRFTIAEPSNWAALFTFLLTALVASHLSDRAQKRAEEARNSQKETEQLYALSRAILLTDATRPIGAQAASSIAQIFELPAAVILDATSGMTFSGGPRELDPGIEQRMQDAVRLATPDHDAARDLDIWPITLGGSPVGALAATGMKASDGAVQSALNLVAIALERVRTEEAAMRAEAARQSEEFKSTLLDAIAHEFKTPLTAIKASATGLRMADTAASADEQELVTIIEEETDRMSRLVTEAVKLSEIDAGKVTLRRVRVEVAALVREAGASFAGRGEERIVEDGTNGAAGEVIADKDLMVLAIRQLLDNALKFSPAGSPVACQIRGEGSRWLVRVTDQGPGIPERDRERIFEKYFRRRSVRDSVPGTGLGLYIAREIARMHGGDIWVEPSGSPGTVFSLALPEAGEAHP